MANDAKMSSDDIFHRSSRLVCVCLCDNAVLYLVKELQCEKKGTKTSLSSLFQFKEKKIFSSLFL